MGCHRLTYHQKTSSKTENTPIFGMGKKQGSDYQVFGMQMPGRSFQSGEYHRGFNGMEKDDEIKGEGNSYTTFFRQYDPRVGRWLSIDPEYKRLPHQSPYANNNNNPISFKDPKGDFGWLGALVGAAAGAVVEYGSQVASNLVQGKPISDAFWGDVDFADVAISAGEGAVIGATGGASLLVTKGTGAALRTMVDATPNDGVESVTGYFGVGRKKSVSAIIKDATSETLGLATGGALSEVGINLDKNLATGITQGVFKGIAGGIIKNDQIGNPFKKLEKLDGPTPVITVDDPIIKSNGEPLPPLPPISEDNFNTPKINIPEGSKEKGGDDNQGKTREVEVPKERVKF